MIILEDQIKHNSCNTVLNTLLNLWENLQNKNFEIMKSNLGGRKRVVKMKKSV